MCEEWGNVRPKMGWRGDFDGGGSSICERDSDLCPKGNQEERTTQTSKTGILLERK